MSDSFFRLLINLCEDCYESQVWHGSRSARRPKLRPLLQTDKVTSYPGSLSAANRDPEASLKGTLTGTPAGSFWGLFKGSFIDSLFGAPFMAPLRVPLWNPLRDPFWAP